MINVMKFGDKAIGECENCGCRFAYGEENIKDFELYGGGKLQTIMSYVECPNCGTQHKVRKGVVEE
mgnify:FL=1